MLITCGLYDDVEKGDHFLLNPTKIPKGCSMKNAPKLKPTWEEFFSVTSIESNMLKDA